LLTTIFLQIKLSLAFIVVSLHVIISLYLRIAAVSLLKLAYIIVEMISRMVIQVINITLKTVVRRASPPVSACEGPSYA
jgi:hypothetical protein